MMETNKKKKVQSRADGQYQDQDDLNFIQEFIARKKLENRILLKIIKKINQTDQQKESPVTPKKKKP